VVIGSHCIGLDYLLGELQQRDVRSKFLAVGSFAGLEAAKRRECDVAGIHLLDPETGQYNRPFLTPSLDLVAGTYRVDAAVHTRNGRAFDYRRNVLRVVVGSRVHDVGVYRPKHEWKFDGPITFTSVDALRHHVPAPIAEAIREAEGEPPKPKRRR